MLDPKDPIVLAGGCCICGSPNPDSPFTLAGGPVLDPDDHDSLWACSDCIAMYEDTDSTNPVDEE